MNDFLGVSTGGSLLKEYYPDRDSMSVLQAALRKRRKNRKKNRFGLMPQDQKELDSANMGFGLL